jgi:hypothetical protein
MENGGHGGGRMLDSGSMRFIRASFGRGLWFRSAARETDRDGDGTAEPGAAPADFAAFGA